MEIVDFIFALFSNQDFLFKIALLILIALYGLFALIIYVQIISLNNILNQINFSPIFKALGFIHFALALALLVFAVLSL